MAINFSGTEQADYVVYQYNGKTFIGKFYISPPSEVTATGGTHASLGYTSSSYYVKNPCEIELNLSIPSTGSADLTWTLKPFFYKELISANETNYKSFVLTIPKALVSISNVGGDIIDSSLLSAYKELCE